jgi:ribosomal protein S18 acetylase RimI-like enzyme
MKLKSLGYRTDLIFAAFDGEISDRGNYLVIRTPTNPTFYWGNFLLFDSPPGEGDFERWRQLFAKEIGSAPETKHQVFGWDSVGGEAGIVQPFLEAGFRLSSSEVLTCQEPHMPPRLNQAVSIRPLEADTDWEEAVELQVVCRDEEFEEGEYREFRLQQMKRYQHMDDAGLGHWYGAFAGQRLVADLGIFHEAEVGRYQHVETHPNFRRRGIAGTLVYEASRHAIAEYDLEVLVIVADQGSPAARLYQSLGFKQTEVQLGLERWPGMALESNGGA